MNRLEEAKEQNELLEFRMFELEKTYEDAEENIKKREERVQHEVTSNVSLILNQWGLTHLLHQIQQTNNGQTNTRDHEQDVAYDDHINVSTVSLSLMIEFSVWIEKDRKQRNHHHVRE